jgi:hypothetical protein
LSNIRKDTESEREREGVYLFNLPLKKVSDREQNTKMEKKKQNYLLMYAIQTE